MEEPLCTRTFVSNILAVYEQNGSARIMWFEVYPQPDNN